ncbi:CoA pyrophosphatase [Chromatiaceae bacterium AAb-1]|nr:CoA pyrophosphatase [Chromatiaceae bacterium AAb-1]
MNAGQFASRFILTPLSGPPPATGSARAAAVLVPVVEHRAGLSVLFTTRAAHLRHHPGQISFPGGRIEPGEHSAQAALREAEEEIGLTADKVRLLGALPEHNTSTGFTIAPWVGLLTPPQHWQLQPDEVSDIFEVPLSYFLDKRNRHHITLPLHGQRHNVYFMPYQDKFIWGATAAILQQLCLHIG